MSEKKWTREACKKVVDECTTKMELRKDYPNVYTAIKRYGWKDLLDELIGIYKKWDYETCKKVVDECTSKMELREKYPSAENAIYNNGWYELFDKFVDGRKLAGQKLTKLTYEACKKAVEDCTTKQELREKYPSVHTTIYNKGWKDLLNVLDGRREHTKEECREAAEKCKTMAEFRREYPNEWGSSYRHGWLPEFDWLEKNVPEETVCIYAYIFPDLKTVYVGLTNNPKRRDKDHRRNFKNSIKYNTSAVYKFCQKNNLDTPNMTILKRDLPADTDGRYWEDYYVKKYKKEGWNVLNIAKTGSTASIGSNATKWTPDLIWKEVYKYNSYRDFLNLTKDTAYRAARKYDMLSEIRAYFGMEIIECIKWSPSLIWNEVYKYNSYTDFFKTKAYYAAWRKGIIPEIKAYYEKRA